MENLWPSLSAAKDVEAHPLLRGPLSKRLWGFYTQRLTRGGRWFLWPTLLFAVYGGVSLQLQNYVPLCYLMGVWAAALLAAPLFRPRVRLVVRQADRVCAGETILADVEIEQTGRLGGFDLTVLPHRLPPAVDAVPEEGVAAAMPRRGTPRRIQVGLRCNRRGIYRLRGWRVESDFPLGLLRSGRVFAEERSLTVYPRFTPLGKLQLPAGRRYHPGGVALASNLGESLEFIGDREYREGDNVRDIDWRATARLNRPIVREYRDEYFMRVAVILDTHVPGEKDPQAGEAFERAVSVSAAVADFMARQDYLVDLFAAGPNLHHLTAGRSLAYLDQILDILACVEAKKEEPFQTIEPALMEHLAKITTVICIFLDWNTARQNFVHRLIGQGAGVKVILVRDRPCSLEADGEFAGESPVVTQQLFEAGLVEL